MNTVAIHIEDLGKSYRIGAKRGGYEMLRGAMANAVTAFGRRVSSLFQRSDARMLDNMIWALRGVSCEIQRGEVVGIVGRNGAGKSTLLKILSRITEPTTGFAEIYGRVGSLLEVGTGFHPELTGRENLYLSGAILGMRKTEIERKFDEIVAFAETEQFIDTPVKHYSSGMYLRLAFAVAAHLEPDILLVDEVLAVGDAAFQKKCLGRMGEVANEGRTVLFISHNMGAITQLCGRALWIDNGQLRLSGASHEVVSSYLSSGAVNRPTWSLPPNERGNTELQVHDVRVSSTGNQLNGIIEFDKSFKVEISYTIFQAIKDVSVTCRITDAQGSIIWTSWDTDTTDWKGKIREPGRYQSVCFVPGRLLRPGRYFLSVGALIHNLKALDRRENILSVDISQIGYRLNQDRLGVITPMLKWAVEKQ